MAYLRWRRLRELVSIDRPTLTSLLLPNRRAGAQGDDLARHWDSVYEAGAYDALSRSDQRHHHRLLASLVAEARPNPSVLEIGCGEGVFFASLKGHAPAGYLGVDVSPLAIERARQSITDPVAAFATGDGRAFAAPGAYDAVVFPECLEYLGDPADVLAHYRRLLTPSGVMGLSMWMSAASVRLWRRVQSLATVRDQAVVLSAWGGGWIVAVLD